MEANETVYPRACGATSASAVRRSCAAGLSPRVRGNLGLRQSLDPSGGSIPARAGQPRPSPESGPQWWVYPRACGATGYGGRKARRGAGLSPRVRGNLDVEQRPHPRRGSIPARAGQPPATPTSSTKSTVYPRACGATGAHGDYIRTMLGLSPRVRGNQRHEASEHTRTGSIPARAGQPLPFPRAAARCSVYPRACGATHRRADDE